MPMWASDLLPDVTGRNLGLPDQRYDAYFRNVNISGTVSGNFTGLAVYKLSSQLLDFDPSPVVDAALGSEIEMTLEGDVSGTTLLNMQPGQIISFILHQDAVGGHNFVWPTQIHGGGDTSTAGSGETFSQLFMTNAAGTDAYAVSPGVIS